MIILVGCNNCLNDKVFGLGDLGAGFTFGFLCIRCFHCYHPAFYCCCLLYLIFRFGFLSFDWKLIRCLFRHWIEVGLAIIVVSLHFWKKSGYFLFNLFCLLFIAEWLLSHLFLLLFWCWNGRWSHLIQNQLFFGWFKCRH